MIPVSSGSEEKERETLLFQGAMGVVLDDMYLSSTAHPTASTKSNVELYAFFIHAYECCNINKGKDVGAI